MYYLYLNWTTNKKSLKQNISDYVLLAATLVGWMEDLVICLAPSSSDGVAIRYV